MNDNIPKLIARPFCLKNECIKQFQLNKSMKDFFNYVIIIKNMNLLDVNFNSMVILLKVVSLIVNKNN